MATEQDEIKKDDEGEPDVYDSSVYQGSVSVLDVANNQQLIWKAELRYNIFCVLSEYFKVNEVAIGQEMINASQIVKECKVIEKYITGE